MKFKLICFMILIFGFTSIGFSLTKTQIENRFKQGLSGDYIGKAKLLDCDGQVATYEISIYTKYGSGADKSMRLAKRQFYVTSDGKAWGIKK